MDTDWCIVCDTKISSEMGCLSEIAIIDNVIKATTEVSEIPSSWAFCSTNCFIEAYEEAQSKDISSIRQPSTQIRNKIPNSGHSPRPSSIKCLKCSSPKHHPKLFIGSNNRPSFNSKSNPQNFISQFSFGSYGSSIHSSNSSSFPAAR